MGFTKLDERIIKSSIMAESPEVFKVWIALLAACDEDGIAELSATYLARVCYLDPDVVVNAIEKLSSPDTLSRSMEHEGRRIERVDGGYKVLNYMTYRQYSLRGAEAERKRLYRMEKKASAGVQVCPDAPAKCPDASASASSSASSSFLDWWESYPRKLGKQDAAKAYGQAAKEGATPEELSRALSNYIAELMNNKTELKYIKHPATFLRADRWKDYLNLPVEMPKQIGESKKKDKSPEYWAEVMRIKKEGLVGEAINEHMKKWEEEHE